MSPHSSSLSTGVVGGARVPSAAAAAAVTGGRGLHGSEDGFFHHGTAGGHHLKRTGSLDWLRPGSSGPAAAATAVGGDGSDTEGGVNPGFDEWERIAQDTLESVLGPQFAAKYQV